MDGNGVQGSRREEMARRLALVGERLGRKLRRPGQARVAGRAPAATRREAPQPANGVPDGHRRDDGVGVGKERHPVLAHVPDRHQHGADEPAIEDQAAFPEGEDAGGIVGVVLPVDHDEEDARADHGGEQDPEAQVHHPLAIEPGPARGASRELHGDQEGGGDEEPVSVQRHYQRPREVQHVVVTGIAERPHSEEEDDRRPACPPAWTPRTRRCRRSPPRSSPGPGRPWR